MREILFRGKRIDNGEWVEGFFVSKEDPLIGIMASFILTQDFDTNGILRSHMDWYKVDHETVGKYTGLTDKNGKNGKKIFEGDIVTGLFSFGMEVKAVITFQDGAFGLRWSRGGAEQFSAFTSICNVEYEVVGNIHDNPELLEEG